MKTTLLALLPFLAFLSFAATPASAKIKTEVIEYQIDGEAFQGFLCYDDADDRKRPGVLVCHEWWGCNDYARQRAEMLATMGYIAFALDMYGKGRTTTDPKVAGEWAGAATGDLALLRKRASAGLKVLADHKLTDAARLGAIGYCMGGTVALELARGGADLKASVAFHASTISARNEADNANVKGRIMVCHGAEDAFVKPGEIEKFQTQMKSAKIDYVFIAYAAAVHAFTNPAADAAKLPSVGYNAAADKRSWVHMREFLAEAFAPKRAG